MDCRSKPRILVCGGRDYADWYRLCDVLDNLTFDRDWIIYDKVNDLFLPDVFIISGGARGADTLAVEWAVMNYCQVDIYMADWKQYGRRAGPIRNQQMLDEGKPDLVVAFPGGRGRMT